MKYLSNIVIASDKLLKYLLVKKAKDDKSVFLHQAGYTIESWMQLEIDLQKLVLNNEATLSHSSFFGDYYEIISTLQGPNGKELLVRTIWMKERFSENTKFITLFPYKKGTR